MDMNINTFTPACITGGLHSTVLWGGVHHRWVTLNIRPEAFYIHLLAEMWLG